MKDNYSKSKTESSVIVNVSNLKWYLVLSVSPIMIMPTLYGMLMSVKN